MPIGDNPTAKNCICHEKYANGALVFKSYQQISPFKYFRYIENSAMRARATRSDFTHILSCEQNTRSIVAKVKEENKIVHSDSSQAMVIGERYGYGPAQETWGYSYPTLGKALDGVVASLLTHFVLS